MRSPVRDSWIVVDEDASPIAVSDLSPEMIHYMLLGGMQSVAGWLDPGALATLTFFSRLQAREGVGGSVAEIGVHHGRLFIALCLLRSDSETAVGIDVFEDQHLNVDASGRGSREHLEAHLERFVSDRQGVQVEKADSLQVEPRRLLRLVDDQPVRLFSVDGCHTATHTASDLLLAYETLAPGGIIALDDFDNEAWPTVREGAESALDGKLLNHLEPVAYGNNKLYLARPEWVERYRRALLDIVPLDGRGPEIQVASRRVPRIVARGLDRWLPEEEWWRLIAPAAHPLRFTRNEPCPGLLVRGWCEREDTGVWSDGEESVVLLPVRSGRGVYEVGLRYEPFLPGDMLVGRSRRRLGVEAWSDERLVDRWTDESTGPTTHRLHIERPSIARRWLELRLCFDVPSIPYEAGLSTQDHRRLAIHLREITWERLT